MFLHLRFLLLSTKGAATVRLTLFLFLLICSLQINAQTRWLIWSHHHEDVEQINGISLGIGSYLGKYSEVNGLKIDLIGLGLLLPVGLGDDPYPTMDSVSIEFYRKKREAYLLEKPVTTNGIFLSLTGDVEDRVNGLSIHPIGGRTNWNNGLALYGFIGITEVNNGVLVCPFWLTTEWSRGLSVSALNSSIVMHGVQLGLYNRSSYTRGFQFGLWNVNEKRSLPFINWNF